jgi:hypothetical protein
MKKVLITFSGARFHDTTAKIFYGGMRSGATNVLVYDDYWLRTRHPEHLLDTAHFVYPGNRGVNWFCWKPFVILDALNWAGPDDAVFYVDGDTYPVADLSVLFDITARDGLMLFMANGWPEQKVWCKRSCFVTMDQDAPKYHLAHCGCARFMGFTQRHRAFLEEWLSYCLLRDCNTFDLNPAYAPELPGFREHRCEQAIMTNLAHKYGHRLYHECDDSGEIIWPDNGGLEAAKADVARDRDLYPQLFKQEWGNSYAPNIEPVDHGQGSFFRNV